MATGGSRCAQILVIISTLCFFGVGAAIITFGVLAKNAGWLEILKDEFAWFETAVFAGMIALGCSVILIGVIGCIAAAQKRRAFLVCYNVFLVIGLILFGAVMGITFFAFGTSKNWSDLSYPAQTEEVSVANMFNEAYCYSKASDICNDVALNEISSIFDVEDYVDILPSNVGGVNELCTESNLDLMENYSNSAVTSIRSACQKGLESCANVDKFEVYSSAVSAFFAQQCPSESGGGSGVMDWCLNLIIEDDDQQDPFESAPYGSCRSQFLTFWSDTTMWIGIALAIALFLLLVVVISTCILSCRGESDESV